jgi:hypothetical protein
MGEGGEGEVVVGPGFGANLLQQFLGFGEGEVIAVVVVVEADFSGGAESGCAAKFAVLEVFWDFGAGVEVDGLGVAFFAGAAQVGAGGGAGHTRATAGMVGGEHPT